MLFVGNGCLGRRWVCLVEVVCSGVLLAEMVLHIFFELLPEFGLGRMAIKQKKPNFSVELFLCGKLDYRKQS